MNDSEYELMNVYQACEYIKRRDKKSITDINFITSAQVIDGSTCVFADGDRVLATARLRFRNNKHIDKDTGVMYLEVSISDIVMNTETAVKSN